MPVAPTRCTVADTRAPPDGEVTVTAGGEVLQRRSEEPSGRLLPGREQERRGAHDRDHLRRAAVGIGGGGEVGQHVLPLVCEGPDLLPGHSMFLAAPPERTSPEIGHCVSERSKRPTVGRNCEVGEMPENDLPQPFPLFRDWMVHSAP